ncbi:MAG: hypothetical protein NZ740_03355 [Kiritimatiellae bacterium]|nr:hypothetical protein [Kiritimatiellia bacterium]MDW8458128.1 hypothetical protein [Verrucomicrobiota bacterium]
MKIVADTHVHVYPFFSLGDQLDAAARQLPRADVRLLCLAEREGQHEFESLRSGSREDGGWLFENTLEEEAVRARKGADVLLVLAGRQIVTRERIEVLALGADVSIHGGLPIRETIRLVRESGAICVLPWGLGKWWGARGRLVRSCLEEFSPGELAFADTALLPHSFPEPPLLRHARAKGFAILHGSDPLPRPGEERITGRWATQWNAAEWDAERPAAAWRRLVRQCAPCAPAGRRCTLFEAAARMR